MLPVKTNLRYGACLKQGLAPATSLFSENEPLRHSQHRDTQPGSHVASFGRKNQKQLSIKTTLGYLLNLKSLANVHDSRPQSIRRKTPKMSVTELQIEYIS